MKGKVSIRDASDLTMNVTVLVTREFRFRLAFAAFLIKLAGRVLRCNVDIVTNRKDGA